VLSGGCALNVLANSRIARLCEELFIQPNAGDSGLPVGAAYAASRPARAAATGRPASPFLGLGLLDGGDVEAAIPPGLHRSRLAEDDPALPGMIARALAGDKIVGLVRGRCEIGPRALGHRSLLANAANPEMRAILNDKIKHREWWRPFAPVSRSVDMAQYFECDCPSPFMLTAAQVRSEYARALSSASHEDGTARLQVLPDRAWDPLLWDILQALKAETGIGVSINTSYNEGGKPLVNSAANAIAMFQQKPIDALWCEGWLLSKELI
jgi:carbamoyltransferase